MISPEEKELSDFPIEMYRVEDKMPEEGRLVLAYCPINNWRVIQNGGEDGWLDSDGDPIEGHPLSYNYIAWGYLPEEPFNL